MILLGHRGTSRSPAPIARGEFLGSSQVPSCPQKGHSGKGSGGALDPIPPTPQATSAVASVSSASKHPTAATGVAPPLGGRWLVHTAVPEKLTHVRSVHQDWTAASVSHCSVFRQQEALEPTRGHSRRVSRS